MAPGVAQNSEAIIAELPVKNGGIDVLVEPMKQCPVERVLPKIEINKPVRRVIRPKVLKNLESREYLYDRLYDTTCPRSVSHSFAFGDYLTKTLRENFLDNLLLFFLPVTACFQTGD